MRIANGMEFKDNLMDDDHIMIQRIAVLETKQNRILDVLEEHEDHQEEQEEIRNKQLIENKKMLQNILSEHAKMRNFWGGVVFTVTAFGSGAVLAFNVFFKE